jgi:hypothetical protein
MKKQNFETELQKNPNKLINKQIYFYHIADEIDRGVKKRFVGNIVDIILVEKPYIIVQHEPLNLGFSTFTESIIKNFENIELITN